MTTPSTATVSRVMEINRPAAMTIKIRVRARNTVEEEEEASFRG